MVVRVLVPLVCLALCRPPLYAHEEPPKTMAERLEREHHRRETAARQIKTETVWKTAGGTRSLHQRTVYDRRGNPVEVVSYAPDGAVLLRTVNHYTADDLLFEQVAYAPTDTERTVFTYLPARLIATATDFALSGYARARLEYKYTDTMILAVKYDSLDMPVYRISYHYPEGTEKGAMAGALQEDGWKEQMMRIRNVYRDDRRTEKQVFDARDSLQHTFLYTYRPDGEFESIMKQLPDGTIGFTRRYAYSPAGPVERITDLDGAETLRTVLEFEYERFGDED